MGNNKSNVTFEIKVYENDWEYILKGNYLDKIIERCNYQFTNRILLINNVTNVEKVKKYAEKKVLNGVLDAYFLVEDYANEVLNYFGIQKDSFAGGYYYSISELVSIYLCKTEFLLHFSSDSFLEDSNVNWIDSAIKIFNERDDIVVANPAWNFAYEYAKKSSISEIDDFYIGYGFSDQCFLIKCIDFKKPIYNEYHIDSERYPKYGGELFEKRVDSFMRNYNKLRITSKKVSYIHINFPKKINFLKKYILNTLLIGD
ncbi:hypothetical protein [Flavobacterium gyeonganense]|uniref:hypothetical protein n=1 Tax=Flavobacterium gyeonganense TaxID=1310418 RepID=UPI0024143228|nr:hypothetical protein [Flavobacterium gyeonganense]